MAAITNLSLYLSSEQSQALVSESSLVLPESDWPSPLPRPCLMIRPDVEQKLRQKLVQCGLGSLILQSDVATCSRGRELIAGLSTVPHKAQSDCLIIDRKRQNATEARMRWATLPHGSLLCQLHLQPDEDARVSGDDVSNFFYLLRRSRETAGRNARARACSGEDAKELGGDPAKRYHLSLNTLYG